jgi:hypothetical protein
MAVFGYAFARVVADSQAEPRLSVSLIRSGPEAPDRFGFVLRNRNAEVMT